MVDTKQACGFRYEIGELETTLKSILVHFEETEFVSRLFKADTDLWTSQDENKWLGWLTIVEQQFNERDTLKAFGKEIAKEGFKHAVLLGMGGSSLCAEVFRKTFGEFPRCPKLHVLDSVVPAQVRWVEKEIDVESTLFIVATKSGSTTEPNVLCQYFYDLTKKTVGDKVGKHFVAITDPGSSMEQTALKLNFRKTFAGLPSIGGRYSVLSHFGTVPAAVMGMDVAQLLESAQSMVKSCSPGITTQNNPGLVLGSILGILAKEGRDKVTLIPTPKIASFGTWLEQLIAESTGKQGIGIVPIDGETVGGPQNYGNDRVFVYLRLSGDSDRTLDNKVEELEKAGHPVIYIDLDDPYSLGGEFYRWEFATAVAGSILGINPFDQPNVQESKDFTKRFLRQWEESGSLPEDVLVFDSKEVTLYADAANKDALEKATNQKNATLKDYLKTHLDRLEAGDYFATTAYIQYCHLLQELIESSRMKVRDKHKVATTFGFGPRFLHSTGQLHKGGANSGVFLQITSDDAEDLAIPGEKFSFGILKQAQSLGDFVALSSRDRRALRAHLKGDLEKALKTLTNAIDQAIS